MTKLPLLAFTLLLSACDREPPPDTAQIEALGMTAAQQGSPAAQQRLRWLADTGNVVARRELGILLRSRPALRGQAEDLLRQAATAGDAQAAFHLGEVVRATAPLAAWQWYQQAADGGQAKAALKLGLMAKNGDGVPPDAALAARWLQRASDLGNAHAMFLLSYAYREGQGVPADANRARALLEEAAEHEYPPALQELALTVDDPQRASHLLKEATEHRRNNWNRF
jgi:TPR repeat protein